MDVPDALYGYNRQLHGSPGTFADLERLYCTRVPLDRLGLWYNYGILLDILRLRMPLCG